MDRIRHINWNIAAPALIVTAATCWGMIGLFSRSLSASGLSVLQITELRCLITALALLAFMGLTNRQLLKIRKKDIFLFLGMGVGSIALFNICYFICMSESTLSIACTLLYTGPCFVMIMSCLLFHEQFTHKKALSVILAFAGCACITGIIGGSGLQISMYALLTGLGSGLGYGLYSIIGRYALKRYDSLTVTAYTFLFASLALLPFAHLGDALQMALAYHGVMSNTLLLGFLSTLLPFICYTKGLAHMETGKAAILTFVEPVVATILSTTVFMESFTTNNAAGIVLIMTSLFILNFRFKGSLEKATALIKN